MMALYDNKKMIVIKTIMYALQSSDFLVLTLFFRDTNNHKIEINSIMG
jgi:hypothetical protein